MVNYSMDSKERFIGLYSSEWILCILAMGYIFHPYYLSKEGMTLFVELSEFAKIVLFLQSMLLGLMANIVYKFVLKYILRQEEEKNYLDARMINPIIPVAIALAALYALNHFGVIQIG